MIKSGIQKLKKIRHLPRQDSRSGMAMIVALIFFAAFITIGTTAFSQANKIDKDTQETWRSDQAVVNARAAAGKAYWLYRHPEKLNEDETLASGEFKEFNNTGDKSNGNYKILGIAGSAGNLSSKIGDYNVYPYPGSGTAGKNCDVYYPIKTEEDIKKIIGEDNKQADFQKPEDYPCNWNKIRSFDSAVEIPLYATAPNGEKVWLKFDEIQVRVRTACDETKFKETDQDKNAKKSEEEILYDENGMCGKGKRYEMLAEYDPTAADGAKKTLENTALNWGIYSDKGDVNYLIPIKDVSKITETANSNIHTKAINEANDEFPPYIPPKGDFVVLDGDTKGQIGYELGKNLEIKKVLNQSLYKPSVNNSKPQISNPYLRLTVEQKFKDAESKFLPPNEPKTIPHLEYQILYKINETSMPIGMDINSAQISGIPVIIGEGYSGGFRHTVKMTIYETKTGFDYVYQKP